MNPKLYENPVRVQSLRFHKSVRVATQPDGRAEEYDFLDASKHRVVIEVHLRQRIVRIWSTNLDRAPVTTMVLGDGCSWTVADDVEVRAQPEGPRAA